MILQTSFYSPDKLKIFIANQNWIFAKTYADTWPHEYIVQEKVDNDLFLELAHHLVDIIDLQSLDELKNYDTTQFSDGFDEAMFKF